MQVISFRYLHTSIKSFEFVYVKTYLLSVFQLKIGDLLANERLFFNPVKSVFSVNYFILN